MASSKAFFVDNMTANEILNLSTETFNQMNEREMSRALRTVALVANKRVNRLMHNAVKRKDGYIEKKSGKPISLDALNYITNNAQTKVKFGVGNKTRDEMYHEIKVIKEFMSMKTSTIKGATEVRKNRERRILKQTREQALKEAEKKYTKDYKKKTGKKPTKKMIKEVLKAKEKEYRDTLSDAWEYWRKFLETKHIPNSPYERFYGSGEVIEKIGQRVKEGAGEEEALQAAKQKYDEKYEEEIIRQMKEINEDIGIEIPSY